MSTVLITKLYIIHIFSKYNSHVLTHCAREEMAALLQTLYCKSFVVWKLLYFESALETWQNPSCYRGHIWFQYYFNEAFYQYKSNLTNVTHWQYHMICIQNDIMQTELGLKKNNWTNTEIKTWITNYTNAKYWDVIIHPCPNFKGNLAKPLG